ncbi:L,D-transpeptidase family protein [Vibrio maritimus]|uniref:L,D-transpeptidase family protein n=1 Tax=Vibrio maritimus TaxID=990268 RepID=UPI001F0189ED|nr:L,D-transpeptidase family protein [Vibrio maritimus]
MYKWLLVLVLSIALPFQALSLELAKDAVVDRVEVKKSSRRMYLMDGDVVVREYRIALGKNPRGHKIQEGDNRTPEGKYYLDFVMDDSAFYRSMHISYPNLRDKKRAQSLGVSPGGNIKIHGLKNDNNKPPQFVQSFDWTNGCIAITNDEMDELVSLVKIGTPIYIRW